MKTKLIMFTLLVLSTMQTMAVKVIISGGTRNNRYFYIYADDNRVECRGAGPNYCPIGIYSSAATKTQPEDVVDKVLSYWEQGKLEGKEVFNDEVPVSWSTDKENNITMNMEYKEGLTFNGDFTEYNKNDEGK